MMWACGPGRPSLAAMAATITDIAKRVYDHAWKLDPIVRRLLDTDFYKLLMLQMIWGLYPDVRGDVLADQPHDRGAARDEIDVQELRAQLDHARTVHFSRRRVIWLAGNSSTAAGRSSRRSSCVVVGGRIPPAAIRRSVSTGS